MNTVTPNRILACAVMTVIVLAAGDVCAAQSNASQALLNALPLPVTRAEAAVTLFTWQDHGSNFDAVGDGAASLGTASDVAFEFEGTPAGPLAASLQRLEQAKGEVAAIMKREVAQSMAGLPSEMQHIADDPQAQAALQNKMAGMSEQQKMAYAMQMAQQMQQAQMQQMQAMAQSAGQPTNADNSAMDHLQDTVTRIAEHRAQAITSYNRSVAVLDDLEQQWAKKHDAIEEAASKEVGAISYARGYESGGGCYSTAAAQRVRRIELKYADRHLAQATRDLAQAREWAAGIRKLLLPVAREDDQMMGDYADIHNAMLRQQAEGIVRDPHGSTFNQYFQPYADGVRDADLQAARWMHARKLLEQQLLETCS